MPANGWENFPIKNVFSLSCTLYSILTLILPANVVLFNEFGGKKRCFGRRAIYIDWVVCTV